MTNLETNRLIALLNLLLKDDMTVFDEFYQLTKYPIYYSIYALSKNHSVTEDILEETYLHFLDKLKTIKPNKNPLGYLLITARNLTLDYFKKENRVTNLEDYENPEEIGSVIEKYDDSERLLIRMQQLLTNDEYQVVTLYILSELTHQEIAKQLHKPLGTITWTYANAIKKLQKGLSDYETD